MNCEREDCVMRIKKIISIGIVVLLMMQICCGCSKESSSGGEDVSASKKDDARFVENIYDMGGKTIKIADGYWIAGESDTLEKQYCAKILKEIEKDYNCHIEVFAPNMSTLEQDITTSAAAGKVYANIINIQHEFSNIYHSGNIADVSTIKNLGVGSNDWLWVGEDFNTINGVQYGVAFLQQQCQSVNWNVLTYNKTLAEKYGIEDMYELVRNKEWTYEKFAEICQTVTTKSNGSVKGMVNGYLCFGNFVSTNDVDFVTNKDGKYVYNCLSDNVLNALQFCQDFNRKGLLDTENYIGNDYGLTESNVFMARKTLFHLSDFWVVSEVFSSGMPDDYGVLPLPMGPDATDYVGVATNCKSYCFIKGDPDIEDAAAILVAMANRTGLTNEEWVAQHVENSLRDDASGEMLELMLANPVSTAYYDVLGNEWGELLRQCIYDMSLTPRQAMEQAQQAAQTEIDEYYAQ